ncbi:MAG TPA: hypothetical protein VFC79_05475, partial [Tissierellaceae bacterium]|nr:hypothetical protein [Tissierellaceae bacterium]
LDAIRYGGNPVGKTANFVVNHSGAAKLGIFVIDQSGRVNLIDPISGRSFGSIDNRPIPLYSDMLLNEYSESSAMNLEKTFWYNDNNVLLPNSVTTVRAGGDIEFTATATFSGSIPFIGSAYVELILRRNGVYYQTLYSDFFERKKAAVSAPSLDFINTVEINEKLIDVPYGAYDILFKSEYIMAANSCKLELSESSLVWTYTPKDTKTVQIGNNGFMAWFGADKHIHLSETEGLKIKGIAADSVTGAVTTAFARVASNAAMSGSTSYLRDGLSLNSSKSSMGKYRLSHNLNTLKYICHVTPTQAARNAAITLQDSYNIDIEFRNEMGDLSDSSFSFSIIELNN